MEWNGLDWIRLELSGLDCIDLIGLDRNGMEWSEVEWIRYD